MRSIIIIWVLVALPIVGTAIGCIASHAAVFDGECSRLMGTNIATSAFLLIAAAAWLVAAIAWSQEGEGCFGIAWYASIAITVAAVVCSIVAALFAAITDRDCVDDAPVLFAFTIVYVAPIAVAMAIIIPLGIAAFITSDEPAPRLVFFPVFVSK